MLSGELRNTITGRKAAAPKAPKANIARRQLGLPLDRSRTHLLVDVLSLPDSKRHDRQGWIGRPGTGQLTPIADE
jgi:hypothetical protein